jgi:DNA invertase Pin-like site-specific DNA recombinase
MGISLIRKPDPKVDYKMPAIVGYCRVSTDGQTLDAQIDELKRAGATKLYAEKQSGARTDRPQLRRAIDALGEGDTLLVTRIDRLARSTRDLLNNLYTVTERGAAFKSLADPWVDTSSPMGEFMLTVLGGVATLERHLIKARTDTGIKRARAAGIKFGRPSALNKHQQEEALKLLADGKLQSEVARLFNVGQATISRLTARAAV